MEFGKDDRRSRNTYVNFHGKKLEHNLLIVEKLKEISENYNKSVPSCAIRFILDYLNDSVVIAGVKNSKQLNTNVESMNWTLQKSDIDLLNGVSLRYE